MRRRRRVGREQAAPVAHLVDTAVLIQTAREISGIETGIGMKAAVETATETGTENATENADGITNVNAQDLHGIHEG